MDFKLLEIWSFLKTRSDDPKEKVWGVAFEISRDFWDRVLEERVGYRERGGYNTTDVEFHQFDVAATQARFLFPKKSFDYLKIYSFKGQRENNGVYLHWRQE